MEVKWREHQKLLCFSEALYSILISKLNDLIEINLLSLFSNIIHYNKFINDTLPPSLLTFNVRSTNSAALQARKSSGLKFPNGAAHHLAAVWFDFDIHRQQVRASKLQSVYVVWGH